ncbi:hypothetical protein [Hyphomonas sp.]|uniref:hypothetical protein n=1 Tax=Hyphomonas sp. TaxID=87 RepID=UPI003528C5A7
MSLFHPPAWFPPQLGFLWPLVWVQVLMLRAQIRAAYGRGVKYHWSITPNLRVYLYSIDWIPGQKTGREGLKPCAYASDRLAAACDGRAALPAYLSHPALSARPGTGRGLARLVLSLVVLAPGLCWDERVRNLPLPDT